MFVDPYRNIPAMHAKHPLLKKEVFVWNFVYKRIRLSPRAGIPAARANVTKRSVNSRHTAEEGSSIKLKAPTLGLFEVTLE